MTFKHRAETQLSPGKKNNVTKVNEIPRDVHYDQSSLIPPCHAAEYRINAPSPLSLTCCLVLWGWFVPTRCCPLDPDHESSFEKQISLCWFQRSYKKPFTWTDLLSYTSINRMNAAALLQCVWSTSCSCLCCIQARLEPWFSHCGHKKTQSLEL